MLKYEEHLMDKMRFLVISAYAPPDTLVGAKRFAFLNQEFVRYGHDVTVLALANKASAGLDSSLPLAGNILRLSNVLPFVTTPRHVWEKIYTRMLVFFATPDPWVGWLFSVVRSGLRQIRTKKLTVIIATGPPFTSLLAGAILARITGVPLILDYRDPWTGYAWPKKKFSNPGWHRMLETWVVRRATGLVFVTQTMSDAFGVQYPGWLGKPFRTITNGFAPPPLSRMQKNADVPCDKKRIIYAGNCYGERSIWFLLEPLLTLIEQGRVNRYEVVVDVFGPIPSADLEKIYTHGAGTLVRQHDLVPHEKIVEELRRGDLLYLVSGSDVAYALPYKIFDYLAAERPILAVAPRHSEVDRFMAEHRCGLFAPINEPARIRHCLDELLSSKAEDWDNRHDQFHWPRLAAAYMEFIENLWEVKSLNA